MLSGLVLGPSEKDDGYLTALEVSGLDLVGTQLVVLSACDTGIGRVTNGVGVQGLRSALVLAGSETQIESLWRVDDDATRELMSDYYRRLAAGGGRSESLRQAQLRFLSDPRRSDPRYWAGFIVSGDPRSLGGKDVDGKDPRETPR